MKEKVHTIILGGMIAVGVLMILSTIIAITIDMFKGDWRYGALFWGGLVCIFSPHYLKSVFTECVDCSSYKQKMRNLKRKHGNPQN